MVSRRRVAVASTVRRQHKAQAARSLRNPACRRRAAQMEALHEPWGDDAVSEDLSWGGAPALAAAETADTASSADAARRTIDLGTTVRGAKVRTARGDAQGCIAENDARLRACVPRAGRAVCRLHAPAARMHAACPAVLSAARALPPRCCESGGARPARGTAWRAPRRAHHHIHPRQRQRRGAPPGADGARGRVAAEWAVQAGRGLGRAHRAQQARCGQGRARVCVCGRVWVVGCCTRCCVGCAAAGGMHAQLCACVGLGATMLLRSQVLCSAARRAPPWHCRAANSPARSLCAPGAAGLAVAAGGAAA